MKEKNQIEMNSFFQNKIVKELDSVGIINEDSKFTGNFSKQWKTYQNTQIDEKNNFNITLNHLQDLFFDNINTIKGKDILEVGCGSGRYTQYFSKMSKICVSLDLSDSVFYNMYKDKKNVFAFKADFTELVAKKKFDIVFCRGVLQHTYNPYKSIMKLFEFIKDDGIVVFDYYLKPKLGMLHPKYLYWRPFFQNFISYNKYENFLKYNIHRLLKIKRFIDFFFFNKFFFSDCIIPIWDASKIIKDSNKIDFDKICELSILDTLDGLYAKYDSPKKNQEIVNYLVKNKIKILKNNKKLNSFILSL